MTKCWLIPFFMAGLLGDKAFADCLPAHDTPASVIEYFQKFNKPLPERFCAREVPPQASHEPQGSSQTEEAPDQYGDGGGLDDGPSAQYEGDPGRGYESDPGGGYERDQGGGYERDQGGGYESDPGGYERHEGGGYESDPVGHERHEGNGYESDPGGYDRDQGGGYEWDQGGGYERDHVGGYLGDWDHDSGDYWKNDEKGHKGGQHRKGDGKQGKRHGKRKSACKKAHMKWNKSTKTCSKSS
jgi:hypothetical protein